MIELDPKFVGPGFESVRKYAFSVNGKILVLDDIAAADRAYKAQAEWLKYWATVKDGRWFPSMADMYQVFKQWANYPEEHGKLKKCLSDVSLLTSTVLLYNSDVLTGNIIHRFGSRSSVFGLEIPAYTYTLFSDVLETDVGLVFLRTLFGTEDSPEEIARTLKGIVDKTLDEIYISTLKLNDRSRGCSLLRVASFDFISNDFSIECLMHPNFSFRSRGIRLSKE